MVNGGLIPWNRPSPVRFVRPRSCSPQATSLVSVAKRTRGRILASAVCIGGATVDGLLGPMWTDEPDESGGFRLRGAARDNGPISRHQTIAGAVLFCDRLAHRGELRADVEISRVGIVIAILSYPFAPGRMVSAIEHKPPLFVRCGRRSEVIRRSLFGSLVRQRRGIIQGFKLACFFKGQPDQHPSATAISKISARSTLQGLTPPSISMDRQAT